MKYRIQHSRPTISRLDEQALFKVLDSGCLACGKFTQDFQKKLASYLGVKACLAVNSGTSALHLALLALKIKPGDEVIMPSYACTALLNAVLYLGARPRIADINLDDFNLNLEDAKRKIFRRSRAIILPYLFGQPADINPFLKLGLPVIENCAQSLGARHKGRPTGALGAISVFSFYATKLAAAGSGGALCAQNRDLVRRAQDLSDFDERNDYKIRFNYKMSDLSAALGASQLSRLNSFILKRRRIAGLYNRLLKSTEIILPEDRGRSHIFFRYVVRVGGAASRVIAALNKKGIEAKKPVFKPLHQYLGLPEGEFPHTEAVYNSAVSLPIYPSLQPQQARLIAETLKEEVLKLS